VCKLMAPPPKYVASEAGEWLGGAIRLLFLRTAKQPRGGSNGSCTTRY
jgi:hypothetical protein